MTDQKSPIKTRQYTLSIKEDQAEFIRRVELCPEYAYILHDKDVDFETGQPVPSHVHAFVHFPNPRFLNSIADYLQVPPNMLQVVVNKTAILQYFLHHTKKSAHKHQYDISEVQSNFDVQPYVNGKVNTLFEDYNQLRSGSITGDAFYRIHKSEIDSSSFFQRFRIFDMISNIENYHKNPTRIPQIHKLIKKNDNELGEANNQ